jgi:hypothetical protein
LLEVVSGYCYPLLMNNPVTTIAHLQTRFNKRQVRDTLTSCSLFLVRSLGLGRT